MSFLEENSELGIKYIWLDVLSMPQGNHPQYDYELHTKPIVHQLHRIVEYCTGCIIVGDIHRQGSNFVGLVEAIEEACEAGPMFLFGPQSTGQFNDKVSVNNFMTGPPLHWS